MTFSKEKINLKTTNQGALIVRGIKDAAASFLINETFLSVSSNYRVTYQAASLTLNLKKDCVTC